MSKNKSSISKAQSYKEIGEYWDMHDIAEHWEETKPAEFEVDIIVFRQTYEKKSQMNVLLTLSVNISFIALGLRPQTPTKAPPLAGFNKISPVAYNHNSQYLHDIIK